MLGSSEAYILFYESMSRWKFLIDIFSFFLKIYWILITFQNHLTIFRPLTKINLSQIIKERLILNLLNK